MAQGGRVVSFFEELRKVDKRCAELDKEIQLIPLRIQERHNRELAEKERKRKEQIWEARESRRLRLEDLDSQVREDMDKWRENRKRERDEKEELEELLRHGRLRARSVAESERDSWH